MQLMGRYYFNITNGRPFTDTEGLELPSLKAVREEAIGFVRDLVRMDPVRRDWSSWTVRVTDEKQRPVFNLAFSEAV
jgi:hypothetical protein